MPALIAHVIYRLDYGGLENGLVNLVNRLPASEFDHAIVCLAGSSDFQRRITRAGVEVVSIDKQAGKDPAAYVRMWRVLRRLRPHIVHTRNLGTIDMQWVALAAGVPVRVHGEHGWTADDPQGLAPGNLRIRKACRPVIQRWVAMSRDIASWLERDVAVPAERVRQLYNGVDAGIFQPVGPALAEAPWAPAAGTLTIGTVGRLDRVKNQSALLAAFHRILDRHPKLRGRLRLIIAGDGPMRRELMEVIERYGIGSDVWLPGARSDVPAVMRTMDVFVLPSLNEGISNTILEAMSTSRPVVAARVGGNSELVEHERTGLLYDSADPGALEEALLRYIEQPQLRLAHGAAARERVLAQFSLDAMVGRYAGFYRDLFDTRS
jgi:sugar transferase (PEP-CTERM/EpsH1 system associated)